MTVHSGVGGGGGCNCARAIKRKHEKEHVHETPLQLSAENPAALSLELYTWSECEDITCCCWVKSQIYTLIWIKGQRSFVLGDFRRQQWSCPHWGAEESADSPAVTCGLPRVPGCAWPQLEGVHDVQEGLTGALAGGGRPAGWHEPSPSHLLRENYTENLFWYTNKYVCQSNNDYTWPDKLS